MEAVVQTSEINTNDNLEIIKRSLYLPRLTEYLENLIISYVDAYHATLNYCLSTPNPEESKVLELNLLSGPINEIYNPNNPRMFDGNTYPAVELILNKVNEYASGLEKGFARTLKSPNSGIELSGEEKEFNTLGYFNLFLFLMLIIFSSIALGCLLFILK